MKKEEINALFKAKVLPISKSPYHFEKHEEVNTVIKAYNPICGDKYELYLDIHENVVQSAYFYGFGCALSKASSSILIEKMEGMRLNDLVNLSETFLQSLKDEKSLPLEDELLQIFNALKSVGGRIDCIKLSWENVNNHLKAQGWK